MKIGIIGAGAMGTGIAQVVATAGNEVWLNDQRPEALAKSKENLKNTIDFLMQKGKMSPAIAELILMNTYYTSDWNDFADADLIIEAIVENLDVKKNLFKELEKIVSPQCILATNTSSLSVTAIAAACQYPNRVIGVHFFNPAPLMPLVEIIPAMQTAIDIQQAVRKWVENWKKTGVTAKDTPGFIVNRIARPFYSESIRIHEEGIADFATIDWALRSIGGFRMGAFELMDFIGNDVNYAVTDSVWNAFFFDPRYRPSFTQKKLVEAGWLGKKAGKGYYDYSMDSIKPLPNMDEGLGRKIVERILAMLFNEAADALFWQIASRDDIDTAMTKGVNYPKGLLKWADEFGIKNIVQLLDELYRFYGEDRYRCSPLLRRKAEENTCFYS